MGHTPGLPLEIQPQAQVSGFTAVNYHWFRDDGLSQHAIPTLSVLAVQPAGSAVASKSFPTDWHVALTIGQLA